MKPTLTTLLIFILFASACVPAPEEPSATTVSPTEIQAAPTDAGVSLDLPTPIPGTVALDFSEKPCSASWSNNGKYLPCPGALDAISGGYANRFDEIVIEGNIHINQPGLRTIPAQLDNQFYAIFGKYPPFTVMAGDQFQAILTCEYGHPNCDVNFSLEYYSPDGQLLQVPGAKWDKQSSPAGSYIYADVELDFLAGKTVQFSLGVRDNGDAADDYAVWIMPHIARLGDAATDAVPYNQLNTTNMETVSVSGIVDMKSAPPYLYDDHPPGSPASVVFFDLNSNLWHTVSTKTTHPNFTIEIYPGEYHVLAYSYGVGDVPYVSGAYTGVDPSCGNEMAVLHVLPDKPLSDVIINDWNWSCGGTASHIEKPEEVSLP